MRQSKRKAERRERGERIREGGEKEWKETQGVRKGEEGETK